MKKHQIDLNILTNVLISNDVKMEEARKNIRAFPSQGVLYQPQ